MNTNKIEKEMRVFSANLQFYMQKYNKTRNDVADIMKVSLTMVSNYINCKKYPRMDKIKLLADYFGITVSELVQDREQLWKQEIQNPEYAQDMWNRLDDMHTELMTPTATPTWEGVPIDEKQRELLLKAIQNLMDMVDIYKK